MRFVSALLFVALTGSVVLADDAKPADPKPEVTKRKVPLRVVKMLPETRQVLLFDKTKGTHVVAEVGQDVDGYVVDDIDDDEVTLVSDSGAQVILTAPAEHHRAAKAAKTAKPTPAANPAPVDPYADPADQAAAPVPVVAGDNGTRVADAAGTADAAPVDPYANLDPGVAAFVRAVDAGASDSTAPSAAPSTAPSTPATAPSTPATAPSTPATTTSAPPAGPSTAPASSTAKAPAKATTDGAALGAVFGGTATADPTPATGAVPAGPTTSSITRAEVNAAIGDFAATASTFRATFTAQGLRFDDVHAGSLLAKIGLQKGDVVSTVDGQPLRSLDDAANLYARLPTARGTTLGVQRSGKPVTLRVAIQ